MTEDAFQGVQGQKELQDPDEVPAFRPRRRWGMLLLVVLVAALVFAVAWQVLNP